MLYHLPHTIYHVPHTMYHMLHTIYYMLCTCRQENLHFFYGKLGNTIPMNIFANVLPQNGMLVGKERR